MIFRPMPLRQKIDRKIGSWALAHIRKEKIHGIKRPECRWLKSRDAPKVPGLAIMGSPGRPQRSQAVRWACPPRGLFLRSRKKYDEIIPVDPAKQRTRFLVEQIAVNLAAGQ